MRIWDLATGETKRLEGHSQEVSGLAWNPDGTMLVSCGGDGKIKVWEPDSGRELPPFEASPKQRVCLEDFGPRTVPVRSTFELSAAEPQSNSCRCIEGESAG